MLHVCFPWVKSPWLSSGLQFLLHFLIMSQAEGQRAQKVLRQPTALMNVRVEVHPGSRVFLLLSQWWRFCIDYLQHCEVWPFFHQKVAELTHIQSCSIRQMPRINEVSSGWLTIMLITAVVGSLPAVLSESRWFHCTCTCTWLHRSFL